MTFNKTENGALLDAVLRVSRMFLPQKYHKILHYTSEFNIILCPLGKCEIFYADFTWNVPLIGCIMWRLLKTIFTQNRQ